MNKKISIAVAIGIVALVSIILAVNKQKPLTKPSEVFEEKIITIADPRPIANAFLPIGVKKDIFKKYGLDVQLLPVQTGDEALKAVIGKSADIALAAITPYAFLAIDKPEIKIFATIAESHDNQIIARRESGVLKPTDLKGKKIGYAKTTVSELGLERFLEANDLKKEDVQWVNLKPLSMPAALFSGEIDAYSVWEPHLQNGAKLLSDDKAIIFDEPENTYTWQMNLFAEQSYIDNNKKNLVQLLNALIETEEFVLNNKEQSVAIVAEHTKISPDTLNDIWSKFEFKVNLRSDLADIIQENLVWANNRREVKSERLPNPASLIYEVIFASSKDQ